MLQWWFSLGVDFAPAQGTFSKVWRQFCLSQVRWEWEGVLVASSGHKPRLLLNILKHTGQLLPHKNYLTQMSTVLRMTEPCTTINWISLLCLQYLHEIFVLFVLLFKISSVLSHTKDFGMALHLSDLLHYSAVAWKTFFSSFRQSYSLRKMILELSYE